MEEGIKGYRCSECGREFIMGYGMNFNDYVYKVQIMKRKMYKWLVQCSYGCWRKVNGRDEVKKVRRRSGVL